MFVEKHPFFEVKFVGITVDQHIVGLYSVQAPEDVHIIRVGIVEKRRITPLFPPPQRRLLPGVSISSSSKDASLIGCICCFTTFAVALRTLPSANRSTCRASTPSGRSSTAATSSSTQ